MEEEVRETTDTTLFEGEGEEEDEEEALETLEGEQVRGIHTIRQKNRVSIGVPISLPLGPLLQQRGQSLPVDILLQLQAYEFYQIQLACSFEAGDHYRFHEARFQLTLETHPVAAGISGTPPAIAYDLFPLQLDDQRQVSIKRSLNPEIKFNFNPIEGSLAIPIYERDEEFIHYKNRRSGGRYACCAGHVFRVARIIPRFSSTESCSALAACLDGLSCSSDGFFHSWRRIA